MPNPILTFRPRPEVRAAVEEVEKLLTVESNLISLEMHSDLQLHADPPDWHWVAQYKPDKASINSLLSRFVLDGLKEFQQGIQKTQPKTVGLKEGYEQILKFLFDHPEIKCARPEHFTEDDPAYSLLRRPWCRLGETEWDAEDVPHSRSKAAAGLAEEELLLKAEGEAAAAIDAIETARVARLKG